MLGKVLNNFPERDEIKILFLRESEGVYRFGSKRVYIKVEKGDAMLVRIGGGFMDIYEFIRIYTPQEVEKIERKPGVFNKFATKMAL